MSEEERRRCCLLGGCGCGPPGSAAQRQALQNWLAKKVQSFHGGDDRTIGEEVSRWLSELPWDDGSQTATMTPKIAGFAIQAGDAVLQAREAGKKQGRSEAFAEIAEFVRLSLQEESDSAAARGTVELSSSVPDPATDN